MRQEVLFFGFGYKKIAAKHGFGPEDVAATQTALDTHAGPALGRGDKRRVEYKGPVYDQNGTRCERIVAISYPFVNNRFGVGSIITSYGSSEADAPDPTQK